MLGAVAYLRHEMAAKEARHMRRTERVEKAGEDGSCNVHPPSGRVIIDIMGRTGRNAT